MLLKMTTKQQIWTYGLLGTVPFLILGFAPWFGGLMPQPVQDQLLMVVYSAIVLSFLGGTYWRHAIAKPRAWLLSFAILVSIAPFLSILLTFFMPVKADFIFAWMGLWFLIALGAEWQLWQWKMQNEDYFRLRTAATIVVIVSLLAAGMAPVG